MKRKLKTALIVILILSLLPSGAFAGPLTDILLKSASTTVKSTPSVSALISFKNVISTVFKPVKELATKSEFEVKEEYFKTWEVAPTLTTQSGEERRPNVSSRSSGIYTADVFSLMRFAYQNSRIQPSDSTGSVTLRGNELTKAENTLKNLGSSSDIVKKTVIDTNTNEVIEEGTLTFSKKDFTTFQILLRAYTGLDVEVPDKFKGSSGIVDALEHVNKGLERIRDDKIESLKEELKSAYPNLTDRQIDERVERENEGVFTNFQGEGKGYFDLKNNLTNHEILALGDKFPNKGNLGLDINREIWENRGLIVYGKPHGSYSNGEYRYLGYTREGTPFTNINHPIDYWSGRPLEDMAWIENPWTNNELISQGKILGGEAAKEVHVFDYIKEDDYKSKTYPAIREWMPNLLAGILLDPDTRQMSYIHKFLEANKDNHKLQGYSLHELYLGLKTMDLSGFNNLEYLDKFMEADWYKKVHVLQPPTDYSWGMAIAWNQSRPGATIYYKTFPLAPNWFNNLELGYALTYDYFDPNEDMEIALMIANTVTKDYEGTRVPIKFVLGNYIKENAKIGEDFLLFETTDYTIEFSPDVSYRQYVFKLEALGDKFKPSMAEGNIVRLYAEINPEMKDGSRAIPDEIRYSDNCVELGLLIPGENLSVDFLEPSTVSPKVDTNFDIVVTYTNRGKNKVENIPLVVTIEGLPPVTKNVTLDAGQRITDNFTFNVPKSALGGAEFKEFNVKAEINPEISLGKRTINEDTYLDNIQEIKINVGSEVPIIVVNGWEKGDGWLNWISKQFNYTTTHDHNYKVWIPGDEDSSGYWDYRVAVNGATEGQKFQGINKIKVDYVKLNGKPDAYHLTGVWDPNKLPRLETRAGYFLEPYVGVKITTEIHAQSLGEARTSHDRVINNYVQEVRTNFSRAFTYDNKASVTMKGVDAKTTHIGSKTLSLSELDKDFTLGGVSVNNVIRGHQGEWGGPTPAKFVSGGEIGLYTHETTIFFEAPLNNRGGKAKPEKRVYINEREPDGNKFADFYATFHCPDNLNWKSNKSRKVNFSVKGSMYDDVYNRNR